MLAEVLETLEGPRPHEEQVFVQLRSGLLGLLLGLGGTHGDEIGLLLEATRGSLYEVPKHALERYNEQRPIHEIHPPGEEHALGPLVDFWRGRKHLKPGVVRWICRGLRRRLAHDQAHALAASN